MPPDPANADYQERIRTSFAKQGLMRTLRATLAEVAPGSVEIEIRPDPSISQQHGFVHAGAVSAIADTAAGYAALTLMPPGRGVLTTEFKINLLAPAVGDRIVARGENDRPPDRDADEHRRAGRHQRLSLQGSHRNATNCGLSVAVQRKRRWRTLV